MRLFAPPPAPGLVSLAAVSILSLSSSTTLAQGLQVGGSAQVSTQGAPTADANATTSAEPAQAAPAAAPATAPAPARVDPETQRKWALRKGATYFGPVGGIYVVDAGSGATESFRLQLMTDFFVKKDYLYNDDKNRYVGGVLSLGVTPIEYLELSAAVTTRSNRNSKTDPEVLQAVGDMHFDIKGYYEPVDGFTFGADVMTSFLNGPGDVGIDFAGTSVTARGNLAFDFRELAAREVPLQLRFNGGWYFDNSTEMVEDLEDARFNNLVDGGFSNATDKSQEYQHLVRRDERLALGINRVDRAILALGLEVPLEVNDDWAIHPIAEWEIGIPVNRRDFNCPFVVDADGDKIAGTDSCLDKEGADTWPQRITIGARLHTALEGLNALAGVEIGTGGTTNFVQELAPQAPYKILLALGYTADLQKKPPVVREVEKRVEVPVVTPVGHVQGTVFEQGTDAVVANARISFTGKNLNPIVATPTGTFTSYPFGPGAIDMEIDAEGYQPGTCTATIPEPAADVEARCELVALPRVGSISGRVIGGDGADMPAVRIVVSGPDSRTFTTDMAGRFRQEGLKPGEYSARIEQEGYLISVTPVVVKIREDATMTIQLVPVPKTAAVKIKEDRLQIKGTIFFATDTADIEVRSEPLLTEIADALIRHPEILQVEVQGHTDDTGTPEHNLELSQRRAEAVKDWLAKAGVERDRVMAKGYGMEKPLVPNLTPQGRAKNRRVEFLITRRAGQ